MINQTTFSTLNQAIAGAQELLTTYAFSDELLGDLTTAFGDEYNREAALDLVSQWQSGEFGSFPEIEILSSDTINGANGAYSVDTNKIYIAKEYLLANADNISAVSDLILEEYGHYVDAQINPEDGAGDEGALFSGLVQGQSFTDEQLQLLKAENDRAVVTIDGEEIAIEQALREGDDNDNTLSGTDDDDQIFAKGGNDSVDGGNGDDQITGLGGNDTIYGGAGNDRINGNDDNDKIFAQEGNDSVNGGNGDDQITGLGGNDTIYGGAGNDRINGNDDNDKIFAQEGNDSVNGGNGDDQITGLGGNDTLDGGAGNDAINGDAGNDMIIGGAGNDSINGGDDNDTIFAKEGNDYVDGGNGNDQITGLDGNDILIGGAGNDAINGGSGNNQLYGGSGEDTFAVSNNANNTIHDFNSGENDKIDLTGGKFHTVVFDTQNSDTIITAKDSANTDFKTIATVKNTQLDNAIDSQDLVFVSESEKQALFPNLNTSVETIVPFIEEWTEKFAQSKGATESNLDLSGVNFAVTQAEVISTTESEPQFNLDQSNPIVNDGTGNLTRIKTVGSITTYNNTFTTESQVSLGTSTSIGSEQSANFTSQVDSSWENQTTVNAGGQIGGIGLSAENTTTFRGGESKTTEVGRIETRDITKTNEEVFTKTTSESRGLENNESNEDTFIVEPQSIGFYNTLTMTGTVNTTLDMEFTSEGNFSFDLSNGQTYEVPINAILQQYDLKDGTIDIYQTSPDSTIRGTDFDDDGTYMYYNDKLSVDLITDVVSSYEFEQAEFVTVTDVLLNGSRPTNTNVKDSLIREADPTNPTQDRFRYQAMDSRENIWIVNNSIQSNFGADYVTGFSPGDDLIGIQHRNINEYGDLDIQYSSGNADIYYNNGTTDTISDDIHLATFEGIEANSLGASNFRFDTDNTTL